MTLTERQSKIIEKMRDNILFLGSAALMSQVFDFAEKQEKQVNAEVPVEIVVGGTPLIMGDLADLHDMVQAFICLFCDHPQDCQCRDEG